MEILSVPGLSFSACALAVYVSGLYLYRVFFDPLSRFPGPKLAAATRWYEFYFDVVKKGRYTWEIANMHDNYGRWKNSNYTNNNWEHFRNKLPDHSIGPIVRINPYELHIRDPEFIDQVYPGPTVRRTEKYIWVTRSLGIKTGFGVTQDHELHRIRRAPFARYFSKSSLQRLEPRIQSVVDKLTMRLEGFKGSGTPIDLMNVFACFTADVVSQYCFNDNRNLLDDPNFAPWWHDVLMNVSENANVLKHFGFIYPMMKAMPSWLVKVLNPQVQELLELQQRFRKQVIETKANIAAGKVPSDQTTIFYDVLLSDDVRPQEKETDHLEDEAFILIAAGTITTAHILAFITFHVINNPSILQKLQAELAKAVSENTALKWQQLEQLTYLTAIITEGLRAGYGVSSRLQRLFPDTTLQYQGYAIPPSTPVSMTAVHIHDDPTLFPEPRSFRPERWIESQEKKKYLLTFSKGSRNCAGMNIAYAELYLALAAVFTPGRFRFELFETDESDVEIVHDFVITSPRLDSKGVRVLVN